MEKFVDVILPLPLHACFTYSLPEDMAGSVQIGCRVVVPFGRKKYYTAIVQNIHYSAPAGYEVKEVSALLDAHPIPFMFKAQASVFQMSALVIEELVYASGEQDIVCQCVQFIAVVEIIGVETNLGSFQ